MSYRSPSPSSSLSRFYLSISITFLLLATIASTGCPKGKNVTLEGWVPTLAGPVWETYEVSGDRAIVGGDQFFKLEYLAEYHLAVEEAYAQDPSGLGFQDGVLQANIILKTWISRDWIIPYVIDGSVPDYYHQNIQLAIDEWNDRTEVRWVPRAEAEYKVDYVRFVLNAEAGGSCGADAGRQGGEQFIYLKWAAATGDVLCSRRTLLHEMGHSMGLKHEHQRTDRDDHVDYLAQNVANPKEKDEFVPVGIAWGDYDYGSVMHYLTSGLAISGTQTLVPRQRPGSDEEPVPAEVLGTGGISKGDVAIINAMVFNTYRINSDDAAYNSRSILAAENVAPESREHMTGDFNGDGLTDLLALRGNDNDLWVALAREDGTFAPATSWHPSLCGAEICAVGDPNGDGYDDIVFANAQGQLRIAASDGQGAFRATYGSVWHPSFGIPGSQLLMGDVDGDCHDDAMVIVEHESGGMPYFNWYVWNGTESSGFSTYSWEKTMLADVNADDRLDLVHVISNGDVYVSLASGTQFGPASRWSHGTCSNSDGCSVFDMDGDKRADVVAMDSDPDHYLDRVRIALSTGTQFVDDVANFHQLDCRRDAPCLLGDVDGNGLGDVIDPIGKLDGTSNKYDRRRGDVFASLAVGQFPDVEGANRFWTEDIGPRNYVLGGGAINPGCLDIGVDPGPGSIGGGSAIGAGSFGGFDLGF